MASAGKVWLDTKFDEPQSDVLTWTNAPLETKIDSDGLSVWPKKDSDNWCRTHYDFGVHDSAHFYSLEIPDDETTVEIMGTVKGFPKHLFDQAGLQIRRSEDSWIKCSTEFTGDLSKLGSVVTNFGYSDWATQSFPYTEGCEITYRMIKYHTNDVCVMYRLSDDDEWKQIRIARLFPLDMPNSTISVGLYCCAPTNEGFQAVFTSFSVKQISLDWMSKLD